MCVNGAYGNNELTCCSLVLLCVVCLVVVVLVLFGFVSSCRSYLSSEDVVKMTVQWYAEGGLVAIEIA